MKTIEIGNDVVTYHFKDEAGQTTSMDIESTDIACIEREIDRGKDTGKLVVNQNVTLYWRVSFE